MKRNQKRIKKAKRMSPDEVFTNGPLSLARYGKHVVMQSNWTEAGHAALMQKLVARYPVVVQEIDQLVASIVSSVSTLPPATLMLRAWQEQVLSSRHIKVEADVTESDAMAMRMIDYVQGIIAATPRAEIQQKDLPDAEWNKLKSDVASLFSKLKAEYPICSAAYRKHAGTADSNAMEEFLMKAQTHWCHVRGNYYQAHQVDIMADLLRSQSPLIEAAYGITSDDLAAELNKIWKSLIFGLQDAMDSLRKIHSEVMDEVLRVIERKEVDLMAQSVPQLVLEIAKKLGHEESMNRNAAAISDLGLFDLRKVTGLPPVFLDDFSWALGEETDFLSDGEFKGWPLRIQPTFRRPFLKLNDSHYCFDLHSLFDHFYRQLEKKIFQRSEAEKQAWIKNRKEISESLPVEYFLRLLPGATVLPEAYYPASAEPGISKNMTEVDCLLAYDDHLFIIEVKAGAFTYTSPADDLPAYMNSLKALVEAPSKQGQRFLKYLRSAKEVDIFDNKKRVVTKLRHHDYRCITICAITLDPFTELAAQTQHLHKIGVDVGDVPAWSLSLSDLRVYSDVFVGPLDFLHFVEQRMRAAASPVLELDDELDHLGLYLEHNNYSMHADELAKNSGRMHFSGYRSPIDTFFSEVLAGTEKPSIPTQNVPAKIRQVVDFLEKNSLPHRSQISSYVLDIAGDCREEISAWLESELSQIEQRGRCLPLSTVGDLRLTIFVNVADVVELNHQRMVEHVQAAMIAAQENERVLLELTYHRSELSQVAMSTVTLHGLSPEQIEQFKPLADGLKEKRLIRSVSDFGKIGRNDSCPCGSGKKFKRCCLRSV